MQGGQTRWFEKFTEYCRLNNMKTFGGIEREEPQEM